MFWTSAFLDFAPDSFEAGVEHWRGVTGFDVSPTRGDHDEFATLVPPDGDDYLRVQRLGDGPSRLHLDLHVHHPKVAAHEAVHLGARIVADHGYIVMASPGGLTFCFVAHEADSVPEPRDWGDGLVSVVDQVSLDIPGARYDAEAVFWQTLTGWERRASPTHEEFERLVRPDGFPLKVLLQRTHEDLGQVRAHLDLATTDRAREVQRHVGLGAEVVREHDHWTVLRAPDGAEYCVTDRSPTG